MEADSIVEKTVEKKGIEVAGTDVATFEAGN